MNFHNYLCYYQCDYASIVIKLICFIFTTIGTICMYNGEGDNYYRRGFFQFKYIHNHLKYDVTQNIISSYIMQYHILTEYQLHYWVIWYAFVGLLLPPTSTCHKTYQCWAIFSISGLLWGSVREFSISGSKIGENLG